MGKILAQGTAIIESLEINASAGDNATLSISLRGTGDLSWYGQSSQSAQSNDQ